MKYISHLNSTTFQMLIVICNYKWLLYVLHVLDPFPLAYNVIFMQTETMQMFCNTATVPNKAENVVFVFFK